MSDAAGNLAKLRGTDWLIITLSAIVFVAAGIWGATQTGGLTAVLQGAASAFTALAVLFLGGLAVLIILKMANGSIDLKYLIADQDGYASLSRFQMLLFTFVVAGLYFIYALYALIQSKSGGACPPALTEQIGSAVSAANTALAAANTDKASATVTAVTAAKQAADSLANACIAFSLPGIPATVLGLIGISGGSYLLSKGIQAAASQGSGDAASNTKGTQADQTATTSVRRNVNQ